MSTSTSSAVFAALTREQEWRFGDIVRVPRTLVPSLQPDDRRWMVVGYAKEQWTLLILDRNSPYLGVETHWTDLSSFELVETMLPVGMPQP